MSVEVNKALVRRYYEEVANGHDVTLIDELVAADFRRHGWSGDDTVGLAALRQFVVEALTAFPDWRFTIDDLIAERDRVVARLTGYATHTGPLWGLPATGRPIQVAEMHIYRVAQGKLAERWDVVDRLALLQQIGALPGFAGPAA